MRTSWIRKALFGSCTRTPRRALRTNASTTSLQLERLEDRITPVVIMWKQTGAGTFDFGTAANWQGGVVPGANDVADFNENITGNETINIASAVTLQELVIGDVDGSNSFNLTGSAITFDNSLGIVMESNSGSAPDSIANAITLEDNTTGLTNASSGSLSLGGVISGAFSADKMGAGTVILGGSNTFSGGTTIAAGTLSISKDGNLGASAAGVTLNGGTLQYTGTGVPIAITAARTITLGSSGGTIDTSGLGAGSGNQTTIAANITGTGPFTLNAHGNTSDSGGSSDSYLALTGTDSFVGGVTISSGVVYATDASFGSTANALTLSGGGLVAPFSTTIARAITLSGSGVLRTYSGTNVTFSGPIGGTGTLRKTDGGTAILTGSDTYSGGTSIGGGTMQIGIGGTGSLGSGAVTDNGGLIFDTSSNVTVAGIISGTGSLAQAGSGTTDLQGANTFTGPTIVNAGILIGDGPNATNSALGTSSLISVNNGGTLESGSVDNGLLGTLSATTGTILLNAGGTLTTSSNTTTNHLRAVTLAGGILGGTGAFSGDSLLYGRWDLDLPVTIAANTSLTSTISALAVALTQTGGTQIIVNNSGASPDLDVAGTFIHPSSIADNGFVKSGTGTIILSGVDTYTGGTTIGAGTLELGDGTNDGSLGNSNVVDNATLVFNDASPLTYHGTISGSGTVLKSNSGTLTLVGSDTYTGATTISGGILDLGDGANDGSLASSSIVDNATLDFNDVNALTYGGTISGSGTLSKSSAGTLTLTGSSGSNIPVAVSAGSLAGGRVGAVSVTSGATVAPGGPTGNAILSTGNVSFASGSTFHANLNGTTAGSGYDQLNVNGAVSLNGATLAIAGSPVLTGGPFILISNDAGDPVGGTFNGLPEGALVSSNFLGSGLSARITYVGGGGNDVAIIVNTPPAISSGPSLFPTPQGVGLAGDSVAADSVYAVVSAPEETVNGAFNAGAAYVYSTITGALVRKLTEPIPATSDQFGQSVSVSGTTVVVSAIDANGPGGAVYVFNAATGALLSTLTEPTPTANDEFGQSVAVSGTTVVIGAPDNDTPTQNAGRAYVMNATTGALIATLAEPTPAAGDLFGFSVAVSGTTVAVGAPGSGAGGTTNGKAYAFNAATGVLIRTLSEPGAVTNDQFGKAVATNGSDIVVGAPGNSAGGTGSGRAYVIGLALGDVIAAISEPTPAANDAFGQAVSIAGNTVVSGAPDNKSAGVGSGRAYIYSLFTDTFVATLSEPSPAASDFFGESVAVSGTTVVVGAAGNSLAAPFSGATYIFSAATGAFVAALAEPSLASVNDFVGLSVAVSGTMVLVGAPLDSTAGPDAGRVYVYSAVSGALLAVLANPAPTEGGTFGMSVAISGTTIVVGAPNDNQGGTASGRAYIFSAVTGALVATLTEPLPAAKDEFGTSVAVSGTTVVVGAANSSTAGVSGSGRVYVYDAVTGALVAAFADPSPTAFGGFGQSVAVSGTTVVVGAPDDNASASQSGRAYLFSATSGNLVATLVEPSPGENDFFGTSVAISGMTVVVGSPGNSAMGTFSGRVYLYNAVTGTLVDTLAEPVPATDDLFGYSVAASATTLTVGAPGASLSGRAYVFSLTGTLDATLTEPSPTNGDEFGDSIAVSGTTVVVGAPENSRIASDQGAAYVQYGIDVADNTTAVMTVSAFDPDLATQSVTYSIVPVASGGGADAAKFQINPATGALSFLSPPSFQNPTDASGNNIYYVTVQATDSAGASATRTIPVDVQSVATNQQMVYVDGDWSNLATGTLIADADPTQAGNQPATFGVNAFANLQGAADAVAADGTITLLTDAAGPYSLSASFTNLFTLNVPTGAVTVSGTLSGAAGFTKAGNGTLILSGNNTFAGGVTINAGKLQVTSNAGLGAAANSVAVGPFGELNFTANTTTSRTFTLSGGILSVSSGQTLTLSGASIGGGFLKGPGTIATRAGSSSTFSGSQATASLTISAFGSDTFANFAEKGALNLAANSSVTLSNLEIDAGGQFNVSGTASASDFLTDGLMTVAGTLTNIGSDGFTFAGGSVTTIAAGGSLNIGTADALVEGGLVVNGGNFGSTTNNVIVNFGGFVHGTGTFHSVITENGGVYSPGNSPGSANLSSFPVNGGGTFEFDISDATGTAGNVDGWDMATVAPNLFSPSSSQILLSATAANPYTVDIDSLLNDGAGKTAGAAADFDPTQGYAWKFIDGTATGTTVSGTFNPAAFAIVTSGFSNAYTGTFSVALGDQGKSLYVVYSPNDYVDNVTWAGLAAGTLIADADPAVAGNQPATLGETAFTHLPDAVHAAPAGGTVEIFPGTYPDAVVLTQAVTLSVSQAGVTVSGTISGSGPLVKTGTGPLTLTGIDTYTGSTTVSAGMLLVDGSIASSTVVSAGATLGGAGTIGGSLASSGIVAPGNAGGSAGTLTTGNPTLGPGTLVLDLSSSGADSVSATGSAVNIAGTTLSLNVGTITPGESFTILTVPGTGSGALQGTFANLPNTGSSFAVGSLTFTVDYAAGDGNDITLTASGVAPTIVSTILNGGIAYVSSPLATKQHSMVENVTYSFSQSVSLSASNFTLSGFQGTPASLTPNVSVSGSGAVWTVTFSGAGVNNSTHSIGDGEYSLVLGGIPGLSSNTYDFFRLLGDMDGDGTVSASDFSTLISTFLRPTSDPLYLGADDLDGDNTIGASDLSQFTANFLHTVPPPLPN